ncbi:unnamed protein product [Arabis nemorensis]|uniref:Uncharacterized protein n=1 Tax=Arabis nemorensis TaxID=586526 RepID=A0A565C149_9BRAS|nr:unnamed protein product [Arabis nemorensis]
MSFPFESISSRNKSDVTKSVSATSRPLHRQPPLKVSGNPKCCPALKKELNGDAGAIRNSQEISRCDQCKGTSRG